MATKKELIYSMSDSADESSGAKKHSVRFDRTDGKKAAPQNTYISKEDLAQIGNPSEIELVIRPKAKAAARAKKS